MKKKDILYLAIVLAVLYLANESAKGIHGKAIVQAAKPDYLKYVNE